MPELRLSPQSYLYLNLPATRCVREWTTSARLSKMPINLPKRQAVTGGIVPSSPIVPAGGVVVAEGSEQRRHVTFGSVHPKRRGSDPEGTVPQSVRLGKELRTVEVVGQRHFSRDVPSVVRETPVHFFIRAQLDSRGNPILHANQRAREWGRLSQPCRWSFATVQRVPLQGCHSEKWRCPPRFHGECVPRLAGTEPPDSESPATLSASARSVK